MNLQLLKNGATLLILVFLFIFTRLLLIYVSDDFYDPEACGIGNVANEILDGLKQPYYLYQHQDNYGNTLVTPLLVMFFFILFGKTSLSLLLAGIVINALILIVLYILLEKFFDKTAAIYASLLFIFSPISYTVSSLFVGHQHNHVALFILLALYFFFNFYFNHKSLRLFGLTSGFGLFFSNIFLFILPICFLFWVIKDKALMIKEFVIYILFVFIGLIPWLYINSINGFKGMNLFRFGFINNGFNLERLYSAYQRVINLIINELPNSFSFKDAIVQRELFNYTYYLIFLFLFIYLIIKYYRLFIKGNIPGTPYRHISTLFIITTIIFFFSIYIFSNFSADGAVYARQYRYLMPIFPFIFIAMSLSILRPYIISKKIIIILLNIIILLGLISNIGLASKYNSYGFAKDSLPKPECYELLGFNFGSRNVHEPAKAFEMCGKLEATKKTECYKGVGLGVADAIGSNPPLIAEKCNQINELYRNTCYLSAGWVFGVKDFFNPLPTSDYDCQFFEENYRPDCYRGVGWAFGWYYGYFPEQVKDKCNNLDAEYKQYCYEWIGYVIGEVKGDISLGVENCKAFNSLSSLCCKGLLEFKYKRIFKHDETVDYCNEIIKYSPVNNYQ